MEPWMDNPSHRKESADSCHQVSSYLQVLERRKVVLGCEGRMEGERGGGECQVAAKKKPCAKEKLAKMKQNYYATKVQACTRGMISRRRVMKDNDVVDFVEPVEDAVDTVVSSQDRDEAKDENPDYGHATGDKEVDDEQREMTGSANVIYPQSAFLSYFSFHTFRPVVYIIFHPRLVRPNVAPMY
jgi:hypothetical protein